MSKFVVMFLSLLIAHSSAQSYTRDNPFFTLEQEKYLASHPSVMAYFANLYTGSTPKQISKQFGLSKETNEKYLNALVKAKIIEQPQNTSFPIKFLVSGVHSHTENGPLSEKFTQLIIEQSFEETLSRWESKDHRKDLYLSIPGYWLTAQEYQELQREITTLGEKYISASVTNRKSKNPEAFRISLLLTMLPKWEPKVFNDVQKNFD